MTAKPSSQGGAQQRALTRLQLQKAPSPGSGFAPRPESELKGGGGRPLKRRSFHARQRGGGAATASIRYVRSCESARAAGGGGRARENGCQSSRWAGRGGGRAARARAGSSC